LTPEEWAIAVDMLAATKTWFTPTCRIGRRRFISVEALASWLDQVEKQANIPLRQRGRPRKTMS